MTCSCGCLAQLEIVWPVYVSGPRPTSTPQPSVFSDTWRDGSKRRPFQAVILAALTDVPVTATDVAYLIRQPHHDTASALSRLYLADRIAREGEHGHYRYRRLRSAA